MKSHRTLGDLWLRSSHQRDNYIRGLIGTITECGPLRTFGKSTFLAVVLGMACTSFNCCAPLAFAQAEDELPNGLNRVQGGQHLTVITDLPIDNEIQQLPMIFDQAMPFWSKLFSVPTEQLHQWRVTLYLMLDRRRFRESGLLTDEIPEFPHGWQSGDKIWVNEQPSSYYRRHLVLHEGSHWFMQRKYGRYHAPWLMEGIAEWLGTHRILDSVLQLGVVPKDKQEVPYWGRITLIQQQVEQGTAPSMESIWRYSDTAHQRLDAYAWSWAMVLFLRNHPSTSKLMSALLKQPAMDTEEMNRWLRSRLRHRLPQLRAEWGVFAAELDYGDPLEAGMLSLSENTVPLSTDITLECDARLGWQATGVKVEAGQKIEVIATGETVLAQQTKPWVCLPDGVTLEYYRGQPMGKLRMAVVGTIDKELPNMLAPETFSVGCQATIEPKTCGEILFRINEANANLHDNSGKITIRIRPSG